MFINIYDILTWKYQKCLGTYDLSNEKAFYGIQFLSDYNKNTFRIHYNIIVEMRTILIYTT